MSKLIILRGLPASSKTTWAEEYVQHQINQGNLKVRIVCRDNIRRDHGFGVKPGRFEDQVTKIHRDSIRAGLKANETVIVADTNLVAKYVKDLAKIAEFFGAEIEVKDFFVELDELIRRDKLRGEFGGHSVGEEIIRSWWERFNFDKGFPANPLELYTGAVLFPKYVPDLSRPKAIIVDLDGTVADHHGLRSPYDYSQVSLDRPRSAVIRNVQMHYRHGDHVIFCSGREDYCRFDSIDWINEYVFPDEFEPMPIYDLFMRKSGDKRQDRIIKGEIFYEHIAPNYNVELVYDDRTQVIKLWRDELGLDAFQVNYGDF